MKTLFIDTHLHDIIIALLEDKKIVNKKCVINKKNNSEYIFPTIVDVIKDSHIDEIIVVNGPGSFTGVRLGVTIAKTLAYTMNISLKTISSLKAMAISTGKYDVLLSDGNGFFIGEFDKNFQEIKEYLYINNNDFENLNNKLKYETNYNLNIEKVVSFLADEEAINPHSAKPIYVKKIGVELDQKSK